VVVEASMSRLLSSAVIAASALIVTLYCAVAAAQVVLP
jgi:hypothetical protein